MDAAFVDGHLIEGILGLVVVEAVGLAWFRRMTGRGPAFGAIAPTLVSGAFLLLALRAALDDGGRALIAVWLLAALVAHAVDLVRRWRT